MTGSKGRSVRYISSVAWEQYLVVKFEFRTRFGTSIEVVDGR